MILVKTMARVARKTLDIVLYDGTTKLTPKIVLIVHFKDVILNLMDELKEFNLIGVYMMTADEMCNIDKFIQPNTDSRILIVKSCYLQGIDLSDTAGIFPRFLYKMQMSIPCPTETREDNFLMSRISYTCVGISTFRIFHGYMEHIINPLTIKEYDNEYEHL